MAGLSRALDRVGIPLTMLETCIDRKDDKEHSLTVQLLQDNHKRCDGRTLKSTGQGGHTTNNVRNLYRQKR